MGDKRFRQLPQSMVDNPLRNIQPSILNGTEEEDQLSLLNNFKQELVSRKARSFNTTVLGQIHTHLLQLIATTNKGKPTTG